MLEISDTGLVAAYSQLERAQLLACNGDFVGCHEAYGRLQAQLRAVAAGVGDTLLLREWEHCLRRLEQEQQLARGWERECADLAAWAERQDSLLTPMQASGTSAPASGASLPFSRRSAPIPSAFNIDPRSFQLEALPPPRQARRAQHDGGSGRGGGTAELDPDVWLPPEPLPASTPSSALSRREREEAYERQRRGSLTPSGSSAGKRGVYADVRPRVYTGAKRAAPEQAGRRAAVEALLERYSGAQELVQQILRDVVEEAPAVAWDDIAGLEDAKRVLRDEAVLPLVMPELFQNVPILKPTKGVLLFGPPGTGKTLLAQAVATAAAAGAGQRTTFINVSPATITKCLRGESEKLTRLMFEVARALEPSVVFIDEIDALCSERGAPGEHEASRRAKTELLTQMDGLASGCGAGPAPRVMLLGATNHPEHVDEALRRRLTKRILIPLPGRQQREALLNLALRKVAMAPDVDVARLAARLEGNSCSDITGLVAAVGRAALRRMLHGEGLTMERSPPSALRPALERAQAELLHGAGLQPADFEAALRNHNPSVSMEDVARHERWASQFGSR